MNIFLQKSERENTAFIFDLIERTMSGYIIELWGSWDREQGMELSLGFAEDKNGHLIYVDGVKAGFWLAKRLDTYIELEQIFLLPAFHGRGVGTYLLNQLIAEAKTSSKPIKLRVLSTNPAWKFYQKLGFQLVNQTKARFFMEYHPNSRGGL